MLKEQGSRLGSVVTEQTRNRDPQGSESPFPRLRGTWRPSRFLLLGGPRGAQAGWLGRRGGSLAGEERMGVRVRGRGKTGQQEGLLAASRRDCP